MALYHKDKKTAPSSNYWAASDCFETIVDDGSRTNDLIGADTPRGALGGMVAAISGAADNTVSICDENKAPMGLFYNDAAGGSYENTPAVASGKIAILPTMSGGDVVLVDVYETHTAGDAAQTYAVGDKVYSSSRGLVTKEQEASGEALGVVVQAPTTEDKRLGILVVYKA